MKKITYKNIFRQLKEDLIGKDSYRGVTLTYSWLANQFGHFALGWIPTSVLFYVLENFFELENPAITSCFIISAFWLLFEIFNLCLPILIKTVPNSKKVLSQRKYVFDVDWKNIIFDTFTDICFFWFGAFSVILPFIYSEISLIFELCFFVLILFLSQYWYKTKMHQSYADYPFQFRLSQWNCKIDEESKDKVNHFMNQNEGGNHLLLFGSKQSGKTSLSVAITNELSIQHRICYYTTAMKLYSMLVSSEEIDISKTWSWQTCEFLVIDDINPGGIIDELVSAKDFLSFIMKEQKDFCVDNKNILKTKNIIWVLGNECLEKPFYENTWVQMLSEIGVEGVKISKINLT